ncbi:MAG: ParB N-terminal domain-containing protein, partial [Bdellovibrionales bacterium]
MSENQELNKKAAKKPALGRGLGSLLGESAKDSVDQSKAMNSFTAQKELALKEGFLEKEVQKKVTVVAEPVREPTKVPDHARIWQINIAKLKPNKRQPRQVFAGEPLKELTLSIKEKGILQPIVARPLIDGQFEIIAGER